MRETKPFVCLWFYLKSLNILLSRYMVSKHDIPLIIVSPCSQESSESAHMHLRRLVEFLADRIHKVWVQRPLRICDRNQNLVCFLECLWSEDRTDIKSHDTPTQLHEACLKSDIIYT